MTLKTLDIQISRNAGTKLLVDMNYYFGVNSTLLEFSRRIKKEKKCSSEYQVFSIKYFFR